jgi:DNA mismatch endonuclease (patch repair protein)
MTPIDAQKFGAGIGEVILTDVVDVATRSRMMSGIKGKNTSPEILIRKALHARGFRFRIHAKGLVGKPDLSFPKYRAVVFVNGCFWHGHDCRYFKLPQTRSEFWLAKITGNKERDIRSQKTLLAKGLRVLIVWECAVRLAKRDHGMILADIISEWLKSDCKFLDVSESYLLNK